MNRFDKLALVAVILVTLICVRGPGDLVYDYYRKQIPDGMLPIGLAGFVIATYGPITVAVLFWRWAKRTSMPWVLHLLLVPSAAGLLSIGEALMLHVIKDPDFDATMDAPLMASTLLFLVAIGTYFGALIAKQVSKSNDQAKPADHR
jgi:hypothetical protein